MRFNLRCIGRVRVPRCFVQKYRRMIDLSAMKYFEVDQVRVEDADRNEMWGLLSDAFGAGVPLGVEGSVLAYKEVGEHNDDWHTVQDARKNWVAPGFLHVVLSGSCVLRCGGVTRSFKRGDVFLLNPNVAHEVTSKTLCVTYTVVVPAHEALRLAS